MGGYLPRMPGASAAPHPSEDGDKRPLQAAPSGPRARCQRLCQCQLVKLPPRRSGLGGVASAERPWPGSACRGPADFCRSRPAACGTGRGTGGASSKPPGAARIRAASPGIRSELLPRWGARGCRASAWSFLPSGCHSTREGTHARVLPAAKQSPPTAPSGLAVTSGRPAGVAGPDPLPPPDGGHAVCHSGLRRPASGTQLLRERARKLEGTAAA